LKSLVFEFGSAVRVFTLNYDIWVENALNRSGINIELGFNDKRQWEAAKFDSNENSDIDIYLYKLHGSIDWTRDSDGVLTLCDTPQPSPELIFGTAAKLSSIDPYLFYVHELRKYSLNEALRYIVVVGYSFSDDYINTLISQAVARSEYLKILVVAPTNNESEEVRRISSCLCVAEDKVVYENMTAKEFFENSMELSYFSKKSGASDDDPF